VSFENLAASRTWRAQLQRLNRAAPTNALIQPASLPRPQAQSASAPPADRKTRRTPVRARTLWHPPHPQGVRQSFHHNGSGSRRPGSVGKRSASAGDPTQRR
jgi:hypothetical protein